MTATIGAKIVSFWTSVQSRGLFEY